MDVLDTTFCLARPEPAHYSAVRQSGRGAFALRRYSNFIENAFATGSTSPRPVVDPSTELPFAQVDQASRADVQRAVELAARAQVAWRRMPQAGRGQILLRLADAIEKRVTEIGQALAYESGKSLEDAENETRYGCEILRYHAHWARRIEGEIIPSDNPSENLMLFREPYGVVVALIPFNYPVYTLLRKIGPALITGNTVIVRPSDHTPTSALEIAHAVAEAGLEPGVLQVLAMDHETAAVLCTQPAVRFITLTGSVAAGRAVLEYSKAQIAKCSLELGGKTPAIVESDADLERAAKEIVASRLTHCGQLCTAVERVYVHRSVAAKFTALVRAAMTEKRCGNRRENSGWMGPLISSSARQEVHRKVQQALKEGAQLLCGGELPAGKGFFYPPTLLVGCRQEMEIVREEVFGPVLCILEYGDFEQALALANDHQYGLSSVLYSENYRHVMRAANEVEAGELYINRTPADPYQGYHAGWKRSGLGGDDGKHGMLEFTQTRLVVMKQT
jgi:lactaldehyde dehydrogenase / glycolaldehyde dehydrogenase